MDSKGLWKLGLKSREVVSCDVVVVEKEKECEWRHFGRLEALKLIRLSQTAG